MVEADDSEIDETPPTPIQVAQQAMILCAVVCRCQLELGAGEPDTFETEARLRRWLDDMDLWSVMEPIELGLLASPLGTVDPRVAGMESWHIEGVALLAWALRWWHFPMEHTKIDPFELAGALEFLSVEAADLIKQAELRAPEELAACREFFYALHCRLCAFRRDKTLMDFESWLEPEWLEQLGVAKGDLIAHSDLIIDGKPIDELDEDSVKLFTCIVEERHRASIWLVGEYPIYTETPADT